LTVQHARVYGDYYEQKPDLRALGITYLGAGFANNPDTPPFVLPADGLWGRPERTLYGYTRDLKIAVVVRYFFEHPLALGLVPEGL
jgi:hypothetical protein